MKVGNLSSRLVCKVCYLQLVSFCAWIKARLLPALFSLETVMLKQLSPQGVPIAAEVLSWHWEHAGAS